MAQPAYIQKTLFMKPEVEKIFDDLDKWLDYCRFEMINFDQKDLYRSREWKEANRGYEYQDRRGRKEFKPRRDFRNGDRFSN
jgi:hypothetical protein